MTDRIAEIKARLDGVPPPPWVNDHPHDHPCWHDAIRTANGLLVAKAWPTTVGDENATSAFIAAAPDDIRWLLNRVAELERG